MRSLLALLLGCLVSIVVAAPPKTPPTPYYDWGACPFECCTYRDWYATSAITAYSTRSESSASAFSLAKGEKVRALTGVVVTTRYGVTKLIAPSKVGYSKSSKTPEAVLDLPSGEVLFTLHYEGEGSYLFWYRGNTYSDDVGDPGDPPQFEVVSKPDYVWWVKIKNAKGIVGWTDAAGELSNTDARGARLTIGWSGRDG